MKELERSHIAAQSRAEIKVYVRKGMAIAFALLAAAFTALGVVAALIGPTELSGFRGSLFGRVMVSLFTVMLFFLTTYALFLVFSSAPRLVVSSEGIWINSPFVFGTGIIPWADMTGVRDVTFWVAPFAHQTCLLIELRDRRTLRARQNRFQAALYLLSGNSLLWPGAVVENDTALSMPSVELLGRIHARYGPELARYGIFVPAAHI